MKVNTSDFIALPGILKKQALLDQDELRIVYGLTLMEESQARCGEQNPVKAKIFLDQISF